MRTAELIPVEVFLATSYNPDCDYIDGVVEERAVGDRITAGNHSRTQLLLLSYFHQRERSWNLRVFPEQRVQIGARRFRIPDVCVVLGSRPREQVFTKPPFLCVEILSPADTVQRLQERIDDYLGFGVPYVWVIDPQGRRGWIHTSEGVREARDGILRTAEPDLAVPLASLFEDEE